MSDNSGSLLGAAPDELLGSPVVDILGESVLDALIAVLDPERAAVSPIAVRIGDVRFDVIAHSSGDLAVLEFEPFLAATEFSTTSMVYAAVHRLARLASITELRRETARELRALTGFDRVMVYYFHPDGHGEVVADERAEDMESYLGLHYPSSDIPSQARELYLTKLSRVIASSSGEGAALVSDKAAPVDLATLDLSRAELRSVSPHHLEFMRNMGQASTMSFSLIHDGFLVGMITCAHRTMRRMPFLLRQGLEVLASQVALQLNSMTQIDLLVRQETARGVRVALIDQWSAGGNLAEALLHGPLTVLDVVPADGASVVLDGHATSIGLVPPREAMLDAVARLTESGHGIRVVAESLATELPEIAAILPSVAGLIISPLGGDGDYIAWFRRELLQMVNWLGDLSPDNRETPLSPRNSFSSWSQSVTGTAAAWNGLEIEAAELCRGLDRAMLGRAESKLAALALHDALTGLPNRRLLMDRLEHALTKYARGEEIAVLFVDLDHFKSVNDTFGHDVGDAIIVQTGAQIVASVRAQDTVARLGGDEFVVLCENTTAEEAEIVADRIVNAVRRPLPVRDGFATVTASVGITAANLSFGATELLRAADAAMYRAKSYGRDRASR